jgi:hypothetical protein
MVREYERIEQTETKIHDWLKGKFLKERLLFGEMVELMLEVFKSLGGRHRSGAKGDLALLTLATRIFNDFEGAKQLLLWGLPDQAQPVIRDIIECTLLFRLFLKKPKTAEKWLMSLTEYQPGDINAKLSEWGIGAKEYSLYGTLSHECHSNLLASLSHVQEMDAGEQGMLRLFHFGSARTPETESFVQDSFLLLLLLLYIVLKEPLATLYCTYSKSDVFGIWHEKIDNLGEKLDKLGSEIIETPVIGTSQVDQTLQELVNKKMRFEEFKRRLKPTP